MLYHYHYPSEFRLIAQFLKCIEILGLNQSIIHQPKMALYHYENGKKATNNLVIYQRQKLFLIHLAKIESKQRNWDKYDFYLKTLSVLSTLSTLSTLSLSSSSISRKIYGSLSKITPYAINYNSNIFNILSIQCIGDGLRYKAKYKEAINEYKKCLSVIESFFDSNKNKNHFIPILRLKCCITRKYALCLLHLRDPNSLQKCLDLNFKILQQESILNDLFIAKIKLCIGQCLILQIQNVEIMQIIWRGNNETIELQSILEANMKNNYNNSNIKNNEIGIVLCARQNLLQSLLILIHLNTVNPSLIKNVSFALSYIYGQTNIKWSAMFLNMSQSVITRHAAIKQYSKKLNDIKKEWHHNKQNNLYTKFYHKLLSMKYYNDNDNDNDNNQISMDYNDYKVCYKMIDIICNKFYSQTISFLQYSWNCLLMEVDDLLQTMLICVINPGSTSRNIPTEIVMVDIAINRDENETKDEEDNDNDNDNDNDDDKIINKYDKIINSFNLFLLEANESTHCGKECSSQIEIKLWWENRFKLDNKLKKYLENIELSILGIFRCLFIPYFRNKQSKKLINSSCHALVIAINEYLLRKTNNEYLITCSNRSCKMILFEKLLQLILIEKSGHDQLNVNDDEIKYALSYIFNINDNYLLNKLLDTVKQHIITINCKFESLLNISSFDPLIICIGDTLKHLPWENIPILQYCLPSICRIPCLEFASLRVYEYNKYNNNNNFYYILNPKGDLKKTEERFNRLLNKNKNKHWNGIKGKIPSFDEFKDGLEKNNVFLYVGHNGGEEFVNCYKLETFNIKSITFLMGCSSGLLKKKGFYQSNGITNYYMIASCPIVVANLWDVTDKDIDQFSCQMLKKSILQQENSDIIDIPRAVTLSRSVCKLKYLNGAAPICYGIPFHLLHGIFV